MKDEPYNYYICECDTTKEMPHKEMVAHLKEVHAMKEPIKAKSELMMHIAKMPRHCSSYKLKIVDGPTIYQYIG